MAGQSMLMGDAFGKSYQYGKRKISAMSNEEFNKLTPEMLASDIQADFNSIIPHLQEAIKSSTEFQSQIIRELGEIVKTIPAEVRYFMGLGGDTNAPFEGTGLPVNPPPTDTVTKAFKNAFIANLLAGAGVAGNAYLTLKGHLDNFFAGVTQFNDMVAKDANKIVSDFVSNITPPKKTPTSPLPVKELPTEEQKNTKLTPSFINSLSRNDLNIGGKRSRMTKQGLIQWEVPFRAKYLNQGAIYSVDQWKSGAWVFFTKRAAATTYTDAVKRINKLKKAIGASYVVEFSQSGGQIRTFYLIKDI